MLQLIYKIMNPVGRPSMLFVTKGARVRIDLCKLQSSKGY